MGDRQQIAIELRIWQWLGKIATASAVFLSGLVLLCANLDMARAQSAAAPREIVILAFGDSLMAGYQIPPNAAFPAQLEAALKAKGYKVRVINSGVSGDTAADGLARLEWSLSEKVDAAIVEFGANDALRGAPPSRAEDALDQILMKLKGQKVELLVAGMESPRNWGEAYVAEFRAMYPKLAAKYGALLYPFFLKDVAGIPPLNLMDGIHPTPEGVGVIVRNILPNVEALIARIDAKDKASVLR